jgi:glycosyltransferase domain-containing protein
MQYNQKALEAWFEISLCNKQCVNNDDANQLSKLTIVIPSYNRQAFILRQAIYWCNSLATIIFIDGSDLPLPVKIRDILSQQSNFIYLYSKTDVFRRLQLASQYIKTPYSVMHSDDEFFIKKSLCKAINILEQDNEIVACNGQVVGFSVSNQEKNICYHEAGYAYFRYSILENNIEDRLSHAMGSYNSASAYAVLRTDLWKDSWVMKSWASAHAGEIYQAITTYLYGKLVTVDEVYMFRSSENKPISIKFTHDRNLTLKKWWLSNKYEIERDEFISQLASIAMKRMKVSNEKARKVISDAVIIFLETNKATIKWHIIQFFRRITPRSMISKILRLVLPASIFNKLQLRIRSMLAGKPQTIPDIKNFLSANIKLSELEEYQLEIQSIEKLIVDFYSVHKK